VPFWVNLSTGLLKIHSVAFLRENVHILYVAKMVAFYKFPGLKTLIQQRPQNPEQKIVDKMGA